MTCFHLSLPPLTNRTSIVKIIVFWRFGLRNVIGAGVIGWRREGVLNLAKKMDRLFYAITMGVTVNCQLSKSVNTFFQYVDQKIFSPKTDKLKKPTCMRIRLLSCAFKWFSSRTLVPLGHALLYHPLNVSQHSDINSVIKFMKIRGAVTKLNAWHKPKSSLSFITKICVRTNERIC